MNVDLLPQFDRAKIKTSVGFYDTLFRLHDMEREGVIPAIVKEYDRKTGKAKVLPIVKRLGDSVDGTEVEMLRPEVEVNVIRTIRGGFCVDVPLFKGDTGWLVAGDRNAKTAIEKNSAILTEDDSEDEPNNEGPQKPDDFDIGKFQYGLFIPASWAELELDEGDDGKLVFSNVDKSCKITVDKDGNMNVIASKIDIDAETDFQQDSHFHMNVDIEGMLDVEGDVDIGGNETVNGNSTVHGNLTVDGEVDIGKNDHASLLESEIVTGYNEETGKLTTWKGKIVRTKGNTGEPIPIGQITVATDDNTIENKNGKLQLLNADTIPFERASDDNPTSLSSEIIGGVRTDTSTKRRSSRIQYRVLAMDMDENSPNYKKLSYINIGGGFSIDGFISSYNPNNSAIASVNIFPNNINPIEDQWGSKTLTYTDNGIEKTTSFFGKNNVTISSSSIPTSSIPDNTSIQICTGLRWDYGSNKKLQAKFDTIVFTRGIAVSRTEGNWTDVFDTTPLSGT